MKLYTVKTPGIIRSIFPNYIWRFSSTSKEIYLTFDDGPTPEVTEFVLDELQKFNAKATFFCIGKNVKCNHRIYERILEEGHAVGNHTFNHLKGTKTKNNIYLENVAHAAAHIHSKLFRPPYGKLRSSQGKALRKKGYSIIMWDVLSGDFDTSITPETCLNNVLQNTKSGSIVVMHDSVKAKDKVYYSLPKILAHFAEKGFEFKAISA